MLRAFYWCLRVEILLQKLQASVACILPDCCVLETVANARVDVDFVGDFLFFEQLLQVVGFFDGDSLVVRAMQDQHWTEAPHEEIHLLRHASEELDNHFYTRVDGGV